MNLSVGRVFGRIFVASCFAFVSSAAFAANTCTWTGAADDGGKWSTPANWQDNLMPVSGNGDRLVFISTDAPLVVSNDMADISVGYVVTSNLTADATVSVTIGGESFVLAGDNDKIRLDCYCATTFDTPITFDCDLKAKFRATADFKFNGDITLNGSKTTQLGGGGTGNNTAIKPNVYFYGRIYGPNAQIDAVNEFNNGVQYYYHYAPVVLRQYDAGMEYRNNHCYFYADGNDIKTLRVVGYGDAYFKKANAFAADNELVQVSTAYTPSIGGEVHLDSDQTFAQLTVDATKGSKRTSVNGSKTLTLTPGEDADLPFWHIQDTVNLCWAPTADCSVTLSTATNGTSGAIYIDRGALKLGDGVRFANLTRLDLAANTGLEIASGAENCFGTSPKVVVRMYSSTAVTLNADVKVKTLFIDGVAQAARSYSAASGDSWINGTGSLTVTAAGNSWAEAGDGDWNVAANWTEGVPTTANETYITRYGNRTISVGAAPATSVGALTMENLAGSTLLDVNAKLSLDGGAVALGKGAQVRVNETGEWFQNFKGAAASADSETLAIRDGATFSVYGGLVNLTNTTGRINIGGADGTPGTFEVTNGTVIVKYSSGNGLCLNENGLLKMTGGKLVYDAGANFVQYGGVIDLSGDAFLESTAGGHNTFLRTTTLLISGNAEFKDTPASQSRWYFTPNNAGETCRIELSDNGFLNVANDTVTLNNGKDGGKTIMTLRGHSRFNSGNGFYMGDGAGTEGEIVVYDNASVRQGSYGYGATFGQKGSVAKPAKGILRMHGGAFYAYRTPNTRTSMQGAIFGNGIGSYSSGPVAKGIFEMTGGALTNGNNAVMAFGAGMAEGTGTQSGGFVYQTTALPVLFGFRGGTGTYEMSGGRFLSKGDVYVGGSPTNVINFYLADLADRPGTGRLSVSGGSFETQSKSIFVSLGGSGTLEVIGTNGVVKVGSHLYLTNSVDAVTSDVQPAKLKFVASEDGCSAIQVAGTMQIASDAELTVDMSAYTGTRSFPLVTCAKVEGAFDPAKITIISDRPDYFYVRQKANGLRLMLHKGTVLMVR